mmetsp:Transcript_14408/g.21774  ORF Transcript_14408/g.21774 Transcript_14408/m.21774 type:complete len:235 (-) Transcript_14408:64-768(-)
MLQIIGLLLCCVLLRTSKSAPFQAQCNPKTPDNTDYKCSNINFYFRNGGDVLPTKDWNKFRWACCLALPGQKCPKGQEMVRLGDPAMIDDFVKHKLGKDQQWQYSNSWIFQCGLKHICVHTKESAKLRGLGKCTKDQAKKGTTKKMKKMKKVKSETHSMITTEEYNYDWSSTTMWLLLSGIAVLTICCCLVMGLLTGCALAFCLRLMSGKTDRLSSIESALAIDDEHDESNIDC